MKALYYGVDRAHAPGEYCQRAVFPHWLFCCFSTPFLYETGEGMREGRAGELLIMAPGSVVYHGPVDADGVFVNDWIQAQGEGLSALLARYPLPLNTAFSVDAPKLLGTCIEKIAREQRQCSAGYEEKVACLLTEAVVDLHRLYSRDPSPAFWRLEQVHRQLLGEPERAWSLEAMAAQAGYSVSRFSQLYRERFGVSPKSDQLARRLDLAQRLLTCSAAPVGEIAERCGFHSIYHFSKAFKRRTGVSPAAYRRKAPVYR